jgi:hypothetical protein
MEKGCLESETIFGRRDECCSTRAWGGCSKQQLTTDRKDNKEQFMNLNSWEVTIQEVLEEFSRQPKEPGQYRVLLEWRAKLAREPHFLQPHQVDEIVREVRKRYKDTLVQQPYNIAVPRLNLATSSSRI